MSSSFFYILQIPVYELIRESRILTNDYSFSLLIKDDKILKGGYKDARDSLIRSHKESTRVKR